MQFGYVDDPAAYARWLWRADVLPVTSNHDFFGASVVQAIYCGCRPLLPRRLAFSEHIPEKLNGDYLYDGFDDLVSRLRAMLSDLRDAHDRRVLSGSPLEPASPHSFVSVSSQPPPAPPELRAHVARYDWSVLAPRYDRLLAGR